MTYLDSYSLKEQFAIRQDFAFELDFTDEYGKLVYDLEELRPGSAKEILKAAFAKLTLQNAIHETLEFDKLDK